MLPVKWTVASIAVTLVIAVSGCGLVGTHIDCDQVAQQQRAGVSDEQIAKDAGFHVADVQYCSQADYETERSENYSEPPRMPVLVWAGSIGFR